MKSPSLAARITLLLVATSLALLGGGALAMDWRIDRAMEARFRENLLTQAQALTTVVEVEQAAGTRTPPGLLAGEGRAWYELRCDGLPPLRSSPPPRRYRPAGRMAPAPTRVLPNCRRDRAGWGR